jgi:hypothetical protein
MNEAWDLRHLAHIANGKMQLVSCDLKYLECTANWEAQRSLTRVSWAHALKWYLITKRQPELAAVLSDAFALIHLSTV